MTRSLDREEPNPQGYVTPRMAAHLADCPIEAVRAWIRMGKLATKWCPERGYTHVRVLPGDVKRLWQERQRASKRRLHGPRGLDRVKE
jgi:hypothetical protein